MKVLVLGSGGREHAIADTLYRQGHEVFCLPGNGGTGLISKTVPTIDPYNFPVLIEWVKEEKIDLTVCGPEMYLEKGIADAFSDQGLKLFGPKKAAAKLESSKAYAKQFMEKHQIPTADFILCHSYEEATSNLDHYFSLWNGVVVKPDGLTGGKGVFCCTTLDEAIKAIKEISLDKRYGEAGECIILEKLLVGKEVSLLAFCDGKSMVPLLPAQDYKRLLDDNQGPNTGGVGAYVRPDFYTTNMHEQVMETIVRSTMEGLNNEKLEYCGVLYFGLMITEEGPFVLEYNCRFGDPETQALLPLIDSDLGKIFEACCSGKLDSSMVVWEPKYSCCVVMYSGGYPDHFQIGYAVHGLETLEKRKEIRIFHAGTQRDELGHVTTAGGRVFGMTGLGETQEEAIEHAYSAVEEIGFYNANFRRDIAGGLLAFRK